MNSGVDRCGRIVRRGGVRYATRRRTQYETALRTFNPDTRNHREVMERVIALLERHGERYEDGHIKMDAYVYNAVVKLGINTEWDALQSCIQEWQTHNLRFASVSNFSVEKWLRYQLKQPYGTANENAVRDTAATRLASSSDDSIKLREFLGGLGDQAGMSSHPVGERLSKVLEIFMVARSLPRWDKMLAKEQKRWLDSVKSHSIKLADLLDHEDADGARLPTLRRMLEEPWANVHNDVGFDRRQRLRVAAAVKKATRKANLLAGVRGDGILSLLFKLDSSPPQLSLVLRKFAEVADRVIPGDRLIGHANSGDSQIRNFIGEMDWMGIWHFQGELSAEAMASCINTLYPNPTKHFFADDVKQMRAAMSSRESGRD